MANEVISYADMTVQEVMAEVGCSENRALELQAIDRDEWAGDVMTVDLDGTVRPTSHGPAWTPEND